MLRGFAEVTNELSDLTHSSINAKNSGN